MKNIILIGAGQLGSRHLQALALLQKPYSIYVVDPVEESLERAEKLYHEVPPESQHSLHFVARLEEISVRLIEYAIIATNSNVRFTVLSQLTSRFEIKNLLFEKILFQELKPRTGEIVTIEFSPQGWTEPAEIYLNSRDGDKFCIITNEFSGNIETIELSK